MDSYLNWKSVLSSDTAYGPRDHIVVARPHRLYIGPAGVNEPRACAIPTSIAVLASSVRSQPAKKISQ